MSTAAGILGIVAALLGFGGSWIAFHAACTQPRYSRTLRDDLVGRASAIDARTTALTKAMVKTTRLSGMAAVVAVLASIAASFSAAFSLIPFAIRYFN